MHFVFNLEKTIQAAAEFMRREPGKQMSYLRLIKLLYIADRECLKEKGRPVTGDSIVAMKNGPVLSHFYDIIKGEHVESPRFNKFFDLRGYKVILAKDPGNDLLNRFELRKLHQISDHYAGKDEWEIVEETHQFPEWKKNNPGESSRPIPLQDLLAAVGYDKKRIKAVFKDAEQIKKLHALFPVP